MSSSEPTNPYAPPASVVPAHPGAGRLWRIEGGLLLVRHGAVLPEVCVWGGGVDLPGQRRELVLRWFPQWGLIPRKTRVSVFLSHRELRKRRLRILLAAILGIAVAGTTAWFIAHRDPPKPLAGQLIPFTTLSFLSVVSAWYASKLRVGPTRTDGWQELIGVRPAAISQLDAIRSHQT